MSRKVHREYGSVSGERQAEGGDFYTACGMIYFEEGTRDDSHVTCKRCLKCLRSRREGKR
jgi:hypothetical protein